MPDYPGEAPDPTTLEDLESRWGSWQDYSPGEEDEPIENIVSDAFALIRAQAERLARAHTGHKYTHGITGEVTYCCPAHQDGYEWLSQTRAEATEQRGRAEKAEAIVALGQAWANAGPDDLPGAEHELLGALAALAALAPVEPAS